MCLVISETGDIIYIIIRNIRRDVTVLNALATTISIESDEQQQHSTQSDSEWTTK